MKKILGLTLGLAMSVGVGVAASSGKISEAKAATITGTFEKLTGDFVPGDYIICSDTDAMRAEVSNKRLAFSSVTVSNNKITNPDSMIVWTISTYGDYLTIQNGTQYAASTTSDGNATLLDSITDKALWTCTGTYEFANKSPRTSNKNLLRKNSSYGFALYATSTGKSLTLYKKALNTQTITSSADETYSDESIELTTNASTATWSITSGSSYASLSSTTGKSVNLIGVAPGSVTVKAVASGYTDATKTVKFNERPAGTYYDVTFNSNGGSLNPAKQSIKENETFDFPSAGDKNHYTFLGWSSDGGTTKYAVGAESPAVTANIEYTAYWQEVSKYTVTYKAGPNGLGEFPDPGIYAGSYTLKEFTKLTGVSANSGYRFKNYTVAGVEKNAGDSITISEAIEVTVNFEVMPRVDTLDRKFTGVSSGSTSYTAWTGKTGVSGAVYAGQSAGGNDSIQLRSTSPAGIITTTSGGTVKKITVVWNSSSASERTIDIYGKNTAYTESANLYASAEATKGTKLGSIVYGTSTELTVTGNYEYIGIRSNNGALYLSEIQIEWEAPNQLSSIALSGDYKTSFASGDTFSFGGTVTAKYTKASDANVTSSATFHLDSASGTSMSGVKLTHASHNGHTIYVKYTENNITKTATYDISVANAPVSSLTIAPSTGKVATKESFDMSEIEVTILPADAVQTYEWTVLSNTVNDDFTFKDDIVEAGNIVGTITLKCTSTADSNKYQTFVLTVSGNPVVTLPNSVTLYTEKTTTVTASVEGGTSPYTYSWSITSGGSYASILSGGSSATVTLSGIAAGSVTLQCSVTDSNGKSDSASVTFSVIASAVTKVNWSASAFDVFSGATIPSNIDDTWEVNYKKNNSDEDYITFGDYELYLGSKEITSLPYTFVADDDGKELHVEYGGVSSSSVAVAVTQSINAVYAPIMEPNTVSWTVSKDALGSKIDSEGGTDKGTISTGTYEWNYTRTLTSLKSGSGDNISYQGETWIQLGSNNAMESIEFTTSNIPGTVKSVSVVVATAGSHKLTIDVGGTKYLENEALQVYSGTVTAENPDPADCVETGTGSSTGAITITIAPTETTRKAMVIRSISVTYETEGSEKVNIANNASHKAAQKAVVAFAKAMNAAFDNTANCIDGVDDAWATASSAYSSNIVNNASLSADEKAYAMNLIKYASAQYTKDTDNNFEYCLERAMATYEICVTKHGMTPFMNNVRSASPVVNKNILEGMTSGSTIAIVVVSVLAVTAIGGYFFIRKRKELN